MKTDIRGPFGNSAIAFAMALGSLCFAQPQSTTFSRVVVTRVKPDMLNEWIDLQKNEVIPALKKGGQTTRTVYATTLFGNAYEYVAITPFAKYAEFDSQSPLVKALGEAGAARLGAKTRKCIESQTAYSATRLTDISNVLDKPSDIIVSARYRIATGKMPDFEALIKSDVLPIYKKAGVSPDRQPKRTRRKPQRRNHGDRVQQNG